MNPAGSPWPLQADYIVHDTDGMGRSTASRQRELLRELEWRGLYVSVLQAGSLWRLRRADADLVPACYGAGWVSPECRVGQ